MYDVAREGLKFICKMTDVHTSKPRKFNTLQIYFFFLHAPAIDSLDDWRMMQASLHLTFHGVCTVCVYIAREHSTSLVNLCRLFCRKWQRANWSSCVQGLTGHTHTVNTCVNGPRWGWGWIKGGICSCFDTFIHFPRETVTFAPVVSLNAKGRAQLWFKLQRHRE